jgi:hypothetical protein
MDEGGADVRLESRTNESFCERIDGELEARICGSGGAGRVRWLVGSWGLPKNKQTTIVGGGALEILRQLASQIAQEDENWNVN